MLNRSTATTTVLISREQEKIVRSFRHLLTAPIKSALKRQSSSEPQASEPSYKCFACGLRFFSSAHCLIHSCCRDAVAKKRRAPLEVAAGKRARRQ